VILGEVQHVLDPGARPLLVEFHLKDSIAGGRARNLSPKFFKLSLGALEVRGRVFVLETVTGGSALKRSRNREASANIGIVLPGYDRGGQGKFLGLSSNGGGVEQVSRALLGLFLSGEHMQDLLPSSRQRQGRVCLLSSWKDR
jgi:hypothetical protein